MFLANIFVHSGLPHKKIIFFHKQQINTLQTIIRSRNGLRNATQCLYSLKYKGLFCSRKEIIWVLSGATIYTRHGTIALQTKEIVPDRDKKQNNDSIALIICE